jgi:TPR repeat protein
MRSFKSVVADEISLYFGRSNQINWSAVTTALMVVSADANNTVALDYDDAINSFRAFMEGRHNTSRDELTVSRLQFESKKGVCEAQTTLGMLYEHGSLVPQNYDEAARLYLLAAERGYAEAQNKLGVMYAVGLGVNQDYSNAVNWYRAAAEQGHVEGQYNLGLAFSKGTGAPQNEEEAIKWWTLAAEQGLDEAQHNLGWHYMDGSVVGQDYSMAHIWYQLAASQGFVNSQNNLGEMYLNGMGVPIDLVQAHMWFSLAGRNGDPDAIQSFEDIEKELTNEQIAEAQQMKLDWLKSRPKLTS